MLTMVEHTDTARFRPDDPDALVAASLACPICLRSDDVAGRPRSRATIRPSNACAQNARSGGGCIWRPSRRCGSG